MAGFNDGLMKMNTNSFKIDKIDKFIHQQNLYIYIISKISKIFERRLEFDAALSLGQTNATKSDAICYKVGCLAPTL